MRQHDRRSVGRIYAIDIKSVVLVVDRLQQKRHILPSTLLFFLSMPVKVTLPFLNCLTFLQSLVMVA